MGGSEGVQNYSNAMIEGFEKETEPLTTKERFLIDPIVRGLNGHVGEAKAITNFQMCASLELGGYGKLSPARLRKIINHIRAEKLVRNLIATSKGYWVETDPAKVRKYVNSLRDRAGAILAVADSYDVEPYHEKNDNTKTDREDQSGHQKEIWQSSPLRAHH